MAYWAELDNNNIVLRVTVGDDNESDKGYQWLIDNLGGTWIETKDDGSLRKNFAQVDDYYDEAKDAFIRPQPFPSWILDENTCQWNSPVAYPEDGYAYYWNESELNWAKIDV